MIEQLCCGFGCFCESVDFCDVILDMVEYFFVEYGFKGVILCDIVGVVQVNQVMICYYFGIKEQFFDEVFWCCGSVLFGQCYLLLDWLLVDSVSFLVEDIIYVYLKL